MLRNPRGGEEADPSVGPIRWQDRHLRPESTHSDTGNARIVGYGRFGFPRGKHKKLSILGGFGQNLS